MHVILEGNSLIPPRTGIGHYTNELLNGIMKSDEIDSVRLLFHERELVDAKDASSASGYAPFYIPSPPPPSFPEKVVSKVIRQRGMRPLLEPYQAQLYGLARRGSASFHKVFPAFAREGRLHTAMTDRLPLVFHAPNYFARHYAGAPVLTIHDLSVLRVPDMHPRKQAQAISEGIGRSIALAARIVTVSEFTKRELIELFDIDPSKVITIPLAASKSFRPRSREEIQSTLSDKGLKYKGYCIFLGTSEPRKNLSRILQAWNELPEAVTLAMPLILVGAAGWKNSDVLAKVRQMEKAGKVQKLGFLPANDLPELLSGARICLYPSLYEGFGLPVLEAMASGVPVITSDRASMPEVAGEAGMLVNPESTREIRDALQLLIHDHALRGRLSRAGIERSRQFTWERCVASTIDVYKSAAEEQNPSTTD